MIRIDSKTARESLWKDNQRQSIAERWRIRARANETECHLDIAIYCSGICYVWLSVSFPSLRTAVRTRVRANGVRNTLQYPIEKQYCPSLAICVAIGDFVSFNSMHLFCFVSCSQIEKYCGFHHQLTLDVMHSLMSRWIHHYFVTYNNDTDHIVIFILFVDLILSRENRFNHAAIAHQR